MPAFRFLVVLLGLLFAVVSHATEWDSCADDLDRLRRAARDATDVAERVKSAAYDLESCRLLRVRPRRDSLCPGVWSR